MAEKIGEITKTQIMEVIKTALEAAGYDVLQVGSGAFGVPAVEGENDRQVPRVELQSPRKCGPCQRPSRKHDGNRYRKRL